MWFKQNYCVSVVCGPSSAAVEFRTDLKEFGMCSSSSWAQTHTPPVQHKLPSVRVTRIPVMGDWMKLIHPSANRSLFRTKFENKSPLQRISSASQWIWLNRCLNMCQNIRQEYFKQQRLKGIWSVSPLKSSDLPVFLINAGYLHVKPAVMKNNQ